MPATPAVISEQNLSRTASCDWTDVSVKRTVEGRLDRSGSLVRIARVLYGIDVGRAMIDMALTEQDSTLCWRKYVERPDADKQYHRIVDVIERGTSPQWS